MSYGPNPGTSAYCVVLKHSYPLSNQRGCLPGRCFGMAYNDGVNVNQRMLTNWTQLQEQGEPRLQFTISFLCCT